jgi:YfiH family protein
MTFITPNWPAASKIKAFSTTRQNGFSLAPFDSFNLAEHVDDKVENVKRNRIKLQTILQLPAEPFWLSQIHSTKVVEAKCDSSYPIADASYTSTTNTICAVLTADCLPLLICDKKASCVAAVHAGWKGLANGIIEETLKTLNIPGEELLVWLGPAIGPDTFEVGEDVLQKFMEYDSHAKKAFRALPNNKWLANIYELAKQRLLNFGVTEIYGGEFCTFTQKDKFFSYRRDKQTGRMASLIWIENCRSG